MVKRFLERSNGTRRRGLGFTLVELLIVMAIIATLLTVALPRYFGSVDKSKEVALKQSLSVMRDALDKYYADHAKYPDELEELVEQRYIRSLPVDPLTERSDTWTIVEVPPNAGLKGSVYDIRSGAEGNASDGTPYAEL